VHWCVVINGRHAVCVCWYMRRLIRVLPRAQGHPPPAFHALVRFSSAAAPPPPLLALEAAVSDTAFRALRSLQRTAPSAPGLHLAVLSELPRHLVAVHLAAKALRGSLRACRRVEREARAGALARGLRGAALRGAEQAAAAATGRALLASPGWGVGLDVLRGGFAAAVAPGQFADANSRRAGRVLELAALLLDALCALRAGGAPPPALAAARGAAGAVVEGALRLRSWGAADLPAAARLAGAVCALRSAGGNGGPVFEPERLGELLRGVLGAALHEGGEPLPAVQLADACAALRALARAPGAPLFGGAEVDALARATGVALAEEAAAAAAADGDAADAVGGEGGGGGGAGALAAASVEAAAAAIDDLLLAGNVAELLREEGLLSGEELGGVGGGGGGGARGVPPAGWSPDPHTPPPVAPAARRPSPALQALHDLVLLARFGCFRGDGGGGTRDAPPSAAVRAAVARACAPPAAPLLRISNAASLGQLAECLTLSGGGGAAGREGSSAALTALARAAWGLPAEQWAPRDAVRFAEALGGGGEGAPLSLALCAQAASIHCLSAPAGGGFTPEGLVRLVGGFDAARVRAPALLVAVCDALAPAPASKGAPPAPATPPEGGVYGRGDALVLGPAPGRAFPPQAPPAATPLRWRDAGGGGGLAALTTAQLTRLLVAVLRCGVRHNALMDALYDGVPVARLVERYRNGQPSLAPLVDVAWVSALCGGLRAPQPWAREAVARIGVEWGNAAAAVAAARGGGGGGGNGDDDALAAATAAWAFGPPLPSGVPPEPAAGAPQPPPPSAHVRRTLQRLHHIAMAVEIASSRPMAPPAPGDAPPPPPPPLPRALAALAARFAQGADGSGAPWPPGALAALDAAAGAPRAAAAAAAAASALPHAPARMQFEVCAAAAAVARRVGYAPPELSAPLGRGLGDGHTTAAFALPSGGRVALLLQPPGAFLRAPLPWLPAPHALGGRPGGTLRAALPPTQQQTLVSAFVASVAKHRERSRASGGGFAVVRLPFSLCAAGGAEEGLLEAYLERRVRQIEAQPFALGGAAGGT
jgi:hypothetical protein